MWSPECDIIDFISVWPYQHPDPYLSCGPAVNALRVQFPHLLDKIRTVALPSTYWLPDQETDDRLHQNIVNFPRLEVLVILVNRDIEIEYARDHALEYPANGREIDYSWKVPQDVERMIDRAIKHRANNLNGLWSLAETPLVRVVDDEEATLGLPYSIDA